ERSTFFEDSPGLRAACACPFGHALAESQAKCKVWERWIAPRRRFMHDARSSFWKRFRSMENFTPLTAALGGALIGLAATILWAVNGRAAGISTVSGAIVPLHRGDALWRLLFLVGLPIGAYAGARIGPSLFAE